MAVFAREPVTTVSSNGNPNPGNHGDSEPPRDPGTTIIHDPVAPAMAQPRPERKGFLHVVAETTISLPGVRLREQLPANDDDSHSGPSVVFLYGPTVTGAILTSSQRNAGQYLSEIAFEGTSFAVPQAKAIRVPGNFGTLTISSEGTFSYTRTDKRAGFTDAFTCTSRGSTPGGNCVTIEVVAKREETMAINRSVAI